MTATLPNRSVLCGAVAIVAMLVSGDAAAQSQNPSPMVETTRAHQRLQRTAFRGLEGSVQGPGGRVQIFVPRRLDSAAPVTLLVHFHGASWIVGRATDALEGNVVSAAVDLGSGSMTYDRAFSAPATFPQLIDSIAAAVSGIAGRDMHFSRVVLSAFSAGHGAVRAILRASANFDAVDAVLLLDGMHTSYVPERTVLAEGGELDEANLGTLAHFARAAIGGRKRMLITHSEIFPGTFASTTETADWLLHEVGVRRTAVLEWGPLGMQQLSTASAGAFELLGFAGNSAPDHVDHFHAMPEMLERLLGEHR